MSAGALTIYVCPNCSTIAGQDHRDGCAGATEGRDAVRVFREEDVRPLYEAAKAMTGGHTTVDVLRVANTFPAPEEWKR